MTIITTDALRRVLGALEPHAASRLTAGEEMRGEGLARLTLVGATLLGLVADKSRARAVGSWAPVMPGEDGEIADLEDVWLSRVQLKDVIGMLEHTTADQVDIQLTERALTVAEVGVLWGGRSITVPTLTAPWGEGRVDAASMLLVACSSAPAVRASVTLPEADDRAMQKTARATGWMAEAVVAATDEHLILVWGTSSIRLARDEDAPSAVPFIGVSREPLPRVGTAVLEGEQVVHEWRVTSLLMDAVLPVRQKDEEVEFDGFWAEVEQWRQDHLTGLDDDLEEADEDDEDASELEDVEDGGESL